MSYLLPGLRRQIMYVYMTLQAIRELLEHDFAVRLAVAFLTLRNVPMLCVTLCACYLAMSALCLFYLLILLSMTGRAYLILCGIRIRYLEGFVHRVTCKTLFHGLPFAVRLMAFHAGWNVPMFIVMAQRACYLCMFARILLKHLAHLCVARGAELCKLRTHSHLCPWSVWICMTGRAGRKLVTVDKPMTRLTFRHYSIPVLLYRVVSVIGCMTLRAIELVLAAPIF